MIDPAALGLYLDLGVQVLLIVVLFYLALALRKVNHISGSFRDSIRSIENAAEEVEKDAKILEYLPFNVRGGKGVSDGE